MVGRDTHTVGKNSGGKTLALLCAPLYREKVPGCFPVIFLATPLETVLHLQASSSAARDEASLMRITRMSASYLLKLVPWAFAAVSTGLLVTVTRKYETLSGQIVDHRRNDMHLRRGEYMPKFAGTTVEGAPRIVGQSARPGDRQVIFFLTSTCPYCKKTLPTWKALAAKLDSTRHANVRVFALTTDSLNIASDFARTHDLGFRLIPFPEPKLARLSHAYTVPQTLVVNHQGRVLYSRLGVMDTRVALDSVLAAVTAPDPRPARTPTTSVSGGRDSALSGH